MWWKKIEGRIGIKFTNIDPELGIRKIVYGVVLRKASNTDNY
jgi:hypothetical protein